MTSSLIFIFFLILLYLLKNRLLIFLLFYPIFFYFLTFDIRHSDIVNNFLVYHKIESFSNYLFYGISILITLILIVLIDYRILNFLKNIKTTEIVYNNSRLKFLFYLMSFISLLGTSINLTHINFSFELLFINPREYELLYGSSTFVNYMCFLSPLIICIFLYLRQKKIKLPYSNILILLLLVGSLLHGVKFTVFDTVLIPFIFYYYLNKTKVSYKLPIILFLFLLIFYLLFSTFIRGGDGMSPFDQVLSYVIPNYINLAYSLNLQNFQWDGLSILTPDKLPGILDQFYIITEDGFVLNEGYNMLTGYINYFRFAWFFGPLLFLLPVVFLRRYLINVASYNILNLFYISIIDYCLLFVFFFHAFVKTKYWYLVFIISLIHFFSKKKVVYES
jgi:hypothetical protein